VSLFRIVFYLLITVFLITIVRGVIGIILKGFSDLLRPSAPPPAPRGPAQDLPLTGELKRDPVCGTFTPAATSIHEKVGGEIFYFCSTQCRDKYVASAAR
jgi:YHS domain-containing protein